MNRKLLALASSLLLVGATAAPVFAQEPRYPEPLHSNGDADFDGIPNADDPVDDRYDEAGNPVRFELGETLPPDSYGNASLVDGKLHGLRAAPAGLAWHRLGKNYYLIDDTGRVTDAVYNKP